MTCRQHPLLSPPSAFSPILCSQIIMRFGGWILSEVHQYIEQGFQPNALLAMGGYPDAKDKQNLFFSPRFNVEVPNSLIQDVFPCLVTMSGMQADIDHKKWPSFKEKIRVLR